MFFTILFLISLFGLVFIYYKTRKTSSESMLHYIKESCNIDSVQFEDGFVSISIFVEKQIIFLFKKIKKMFKAFVHHKNNTIHKTKKSIRKKLFTRVQKESISEFISHMKK